MAGSDLLVAPDGLAVTVGVPKNTTFSSSYCCIYVIMLQHKQLWKISCLKITPGGRKSSKLALFFEICISVDWLVRTAVAAIKELDCMNLGVFSLKREKNQSGFKKAIRRETKVKEYNRV